MSIYARWGREWLHLGHKTRNERRAPIESEMFPRGHEAVLRPATGDLFPYSRIPLFPAISQVHLTHSMAASSSNFQLLINNALKLYHKQTKNDILLHPLAAQLQTCDSPSDILAILQQQVQGIDQSRSSDDRWTKWLDPTIHVLLTFSRTVGTVGLVCPRTSTYPRSAHSYSFGRHSHPRR